MFKINMSKIFDEMTLVCKAKNQICSVNRDSQRMKSIIMMVNYYYYYDLVWPCISAYHAGVPITYNLKAYRGKNQIIQILYVGCEHDFALEQKLLWGAIKKKKHQTKQKQEEIIPRGWLNRRKADHRKHMFCLSTVKNHLPDGQTPFFLFQDRKKLRNKTQLTL